MIKVKLTEERPPAECVASAFDVYFPEKPPVLVRAFIVDLAFEFLAHYVPESDRQPILTAMFESLIDNKDLEWELRKIFEEKIERCQYTEYFQAG
jgi:hypothetical protein